MSGRPAAAGIDALPFEDGCFDAVMVNQVLHHLADSPPDGWPMLRRVLGEFARVLRPGGVAVINTCSHEQLRRGWWYASLVPEAVETIRRRYADREVLTALLAGPDSPRGADSCRVTRSCRAMRISTVAGRSTPHGAAATRCGRWCRTRSWNVPSTASTPSTKRERSMPSSPSRTACGRPSDRSDSIAPCANLRRRPLAQSRTVGRSTGPKRPGASHATRIGDGRPGRPGSPASMGVNRSRMRSPVLPLYAETRSAIASIRCISRSTGFSMSLPLITTRPVSASSKVRMMRRARSICAASGVNTALRAGICFG